MDAKTRSSTAARTVIIRFFSIDEDDRRMICAVMTDRQQSNDYNHGQR